ncbi:hypothetical protein NW762_001342 [Fusarium torreyae]|uniref:Uncharacterized protein n=1 Tax=Fusarium torreyae TaxID=1237075 RepID=A0A9W8VNV5_9HYPO|nr:hypothetical protein NW762_001342 [Fusarium torreyae]
MDPISEVIRGWWLTTVVGAVPFFVSLIAILFYIGFLQWSIQKFATFFFWSIRVSGVEANVAAACPLVSQGESAILVKPFVAHLTTAELHQVMTSGFSTIAGAVLIVYIQMSVDPRALVSACVMSIPESLAVSKIRCPETEDSLTSVQFTIHQDERPPSNILEAFTNGALLGLRIAATIATTVLRIIALVACIDGFLSWWGQYLSIHDPDLTLDLIMGYFCYPIAFLIGASREYGDLLKADHLIGVELITVAPGRSSQVSQLAVSADATGAVST